MASQLKLDQQLFNAVEENNLEGVQNLLAQGANVNFSDDYARTPLNEAARQGNLAIVSVLLESGADPTMACENGYPVDMIGGNRTVAKPIETLLYARMYVFSLIFFAVEAGDIAMAESALLQGGSVNVSKPMGETPLSLAVESQNLEMVTWLISHGADVKAIVRNGETILTLAKTANIAELLIVNGADVNHANHYGEALLFRAVMAGNLALTELFINHGAVVDNPNNIHATPIELAKCFGYVTIARLLLNNGASFPEDADWLSLLLDRKLVIQGEVFDDAEILLLVLIHHHSDDRSWMTNDLCAFLITQGADVNATDVNDNTALHLTHCVEVLLKAGANIDAKNLDGESPLLKVLRTAKHSDDYQAADALIKHGADITILQKLNADETYVLLNAAARYGCLHLLEKLVKLGLDVNNRHDGSYSLIRAASQNELEVAKRLIAHGAEVNLSNDDGRTALIKSGSLAMAQLMIDSGARIDEVDSEGNTLLHLWCGAQQPKLEMVEFLIKQGLDVNARKHAGETPLQCAEDSALVANYLLEHGANTDCVLDDLGWNDDLTRVVLGYQAWKRQQVEVTLS